MKEAIQQFTYSLAREVADDNIRVTCVSPDLIRTRFQDSLAPEQASIISRIGSRSIAKASLRAAQR